MWMKKSEAAKRVSFVVLLRARSFFVPLWRVFSLRTFRVLVALVYVLSLAAAVPLIGTQTVHAGSIVTVASATAGSTANVSSLQINKPTGTASGDVLIAVIGLSLSNATITAPAGWNSITSQTQGSTNLKVEAFYLVAGGSEPANYTWTIPGPSATRMAGGISTFRGVNTSGSPVDVSGAGNSGASTTSATTSGTTISATTSPTKVISVFGADNTNTVTFTPGSGNERFDAGSNSGSANDVSLQLFDSVKASSGAVAQSASTISSSSNYAAFQVVLKPDSVIHMLLFWDGTDTGGSPIGIPTGWSLVDDFDGLYPRGETAANFGATGGVADHQPTTSSVTQNYVNGGGSNNLSGNSNSTTVPAQAHSHSPTGTIGTASNEPAFRTLKLIRYDSGVPNVIPTGGIALFDDSPNTLPANWTNLSGTTDVFYHRTIKLSSTANTNGGNTNDQHQHSITWGMSAATGTTTGVNPLVVNGTPASPTHTHTSPSNSNTTATTALPPYVEPRIAKAGVDTQTISIGITAMFDGDPGGGWVIRSKSSGPAVETAYYQRFLRPADAFGAGANNPTHSHASVTSGNSGTNVGALGNNSNLNLAIPPAVSGNGHAHTLTANFNANDTHTPPYFNVVVAEKVNFILNAFFWYNDDNTGTATDTTPNDIWANPDLAVSSPIILLPISSADPPDLTRELRLRIQILINGNNLDPSVVRYKLQYNATRSASCTTTNGSWVDVAESSDNGAPWRFATSNVNSEETLSTSVFSSPASTIMGRYVKSNSGSNNNPSASIGDYMEYDYHIQHNAAFGAAQYSFRLIEGTGTLLSQYTVCPTLSARPRSDNQLRHGNFFEVDPSGEASGVLERGFSWAD